MFETLGIKTLEDAYGSTMQIFPNGSNWKDRGRLKGCCLAFAQALLFPKSMAAAIKAT